MSLVEQQLININIEFIGGGGDSRSFTFKFYSRCNFSEEGGATITQNSYKPSLDL